MEGHRCKPQSWRLLTRCVSAHFSAHNGSRRSSPSPTTTADRSGRGGQERRLRAANSERLTREHACPPQAVLQVRVGLAREAIVLVGGADESLSSTPNRRSESVRVSSGRAEPCAVFLRPEPQRRTFLVMMKEVPIAIEDETASARPMYLSFGSKVLVASWAAATASMLHLGSELERAGVLRPA